MSAEVLETAGQIMSRLLAFPDRVTPSPDPIPEGETAQDRDDRLARQAGNRRLRFDRQRPARYADARVRDLATDAQRTMLDWLAGPSRALVVSGPVGVGKTHAAWALASHAVDAGGDVAAWTVPDFLVAVAPEGDPTALRTAQKVPLLLLDDLGVEKPSEWRVEQLTALFDHRMREDRRQVITTNADYQTLEARYGERVMSRLTGDAVILRLTGPDRRRTAW